MRNGSASVSPRGDTAGAAEHAPAGSVGAPQMGVTMPQPLAEELKSIPMSSNLGESLERAHRFAREQSHRSVTLEHLLLALAEDPEAALILQSANVDLARLSTDVSGYLGRLLEDMRAEPGIDPQPDAELLRVVQAAASAAQQSRRRQIDGAIVLAAIVGDGKSPAAGMLKALGMTFEEAIRALQRANTKARLQPTAQSAAKSAPAPQDGGDTASDLTPGGVAAAPATLPAQPPAAAPPIAQSAEEILAAARARIQQRSAVAQAELAGKSARPPAAATPPAGEVKAPPARGAPASESLSSAIEAAMEAPTVRRSDTARPAPPAAPTPAPGAARSTQPPWTSPEPRPQPPAAPGPTPSGEASQPPPPPPPPRPVAGGAVRLPNPPARAPWPETGERRTGRRARANGEHAPAHRGVQAARPQEPPWAAPPQRAVLSDRGPLVESIPRRMRERVAVTGEVRITRDRIETLMQALTSAGPQRPGAHLARTLCVRLRAPNGGFAIETMTPETQWIESNANLVHDDTALWRWTIVPQRRGRGRLLLTLSARTIGADALSAETAPPDRMIDVRVKANYARRCARLVVFTATLAAGVLLGRFGEQAWSAALAALKQALGG
jgi:neural Wiskott-Aldrich syndrome protein